LHSIPYHAIPETSDERLAGEQQRCHPKHRHITIDKSVHRFVAFGRSTLPVKTFGRVSTVEIEPAGSLW
jgi:hypothetical protein